MADRPRPEGDADWHTRYLQLKRALFDRATGLPAVPVHFDRLRTLLDSRRHLGVVHLEVVDLDTIESIYGWQVFDRLVARIAAVLSGIVGDVVPEGTLLAVNGVAGDRFVAFVPHGSRGREVEPHELARTAAAVCERVEREFDCDDMAGLSPRPWFRAGSALLGVNPFYRFERSVYAAIDEAREAPERRERRRELSWGEELQRIIQQETVDTVFQPIVEIESREVLGWEALARGPRDTMFETPRAMFSLSTRVGMATELDRLCCEAAIAAFAGGPATGKLFLNTLPATLDDAAWTEERLLPLLDGFGMAPGAVVIEVSERHVDPPEGIDRLSGFRSRGFGIALDDVGTGKLTRETIERARPDFLKLDGSLVHDLHENLVQQEILATLIRLAHRIGAEVVAEGVECAEEAETLVRAGARFGQGWHFAAPGADERRARRGRGRPRRPRSEKPP
jgi:EAL domain-containing protein (putative c-di-GMP-specific phosphodiesterase class I)/GGDEF domain-containing protein